MDKDQMVLLQYEDELTQKRFGDLTQDDLEAAINEELFILAVDTDGRFKQASIGSDEEEEPTLEIIHWDEIRTEKVPA